MFDIVKQLVTSYNKVSLIIRIIVGLIVGLILGLIIPNIMAISMLGDLFVGALKAIAPVLVFVFVFVLVASSLMQGHQKLNKKFQLVIWLYVVGTVAASIVAVIASFLFPVSITLATSQDSGALPSGIGDVIKNVLMGMIANPILSISEGKYLGILFWAALFGISLKTIASEHTKRLMHDFASGASTIVKWIISFAPFGILGIVYANVSTNGISIFKDYAGLLAVLVGAMLFVALVMNPAICFAMLRKNPYPLIFKCLKESGLTAFFTRSSAANIPVNMQLCNRLKLDEEVYSVSIPLGATINMSGAAVTIAVFTLAAAHTLNITVDLPSALLLCILSSVQPAVHLELRVAPYYLFQWHALYFGLVKIKRCRL